MNELNEREKIILETIIQNFILTAMPVGSSLIAKKTHLDMSQATIRHIMADLEKKGYIYQPHPSAGRIPTTYGYRIYVDSLMKRARLSTAEKEKIRSSLQQNASELDDIMKEATRILAHLSHQLGVVVSPKLDQGIFDRMEIINLSSERILIILTIKSGMIKTISMEIDSRITRQNLELLNQILNERLHGMKLADIRKNFSEIVKDIQNEDTGLVRIFLRTSDRIFDFDENKNIFVMGTHNILLQPEFSDVQSFSSVVELLEEQEVIIHLLDEEEENKPLRIKIGEEIREKRMQNCSIISTKYNVGQITGSLGIIGPKRMNYGKLISLVEYTAKTISEIYEKN